MKQTSEGLLRSFGWWPERNGGDAWIRLWKQSSPQFEKEVRSLTGLEFTRLPSSDSRFSPEDISFVYRDWAYFELMEVISAPSALLPIGYDCRANGLIAIDSTSGVVVHTDGFKIVMTEGSIIDGVCQLLTYSGEIQVDMFDEWKRSRGLE